MQVLSTQNYNKNIPKKYYTAKTLKIHKSTVSNKTWLLLDTLYISNICD